MHSRYRMWSYKQALVADHIMINHVICGNFIEQPLGAGYFGLLDGT